MSDSQEDEIFDNDDKSRSFNIKQLTQRTSNILLANNINKYTIQVKPSKGSSTNRKSVTNGKSIRITNHQKKVEHTDEIYRQILIQNKNIGKKTFNAKLESKKRSNMISISTNFKSILSERNQSQLTQKVDTLQSVKVKVGSTRPMSGNRQQTKQPVGQDRPETLVFAKKTSGQ